MCLVVIHSTPISTRPRCTLSTLRAKRPTRCVVILGAHSVVAGLVSSNEATIPKVTGTSLSMSCDVVG